MRAAKPIRYAGRITTWKDEQGFGFITPNGGGPTVFVHISAFDGQRGRPAGNEIVTYELTANERGQPRAGKVAFYRAGAARRQATTGRPARALLACGFFAALALFVAVSRLPAWALAVYAGISVLTFLVYASDKAAARKNAWRTKESTLHMLGLAGGWPGALLAQHLLRHKSSKPGFQPGLWFTVFANCLALGWFMSTGGMA